MVGIDCLSLDSLSYSSSSSSSDGLFPVTVYKEFELRPTRHRYKMNRKHRGILVLIDNQIFDKWSDRKGQNRDVNNYIGTFKMLGFQIELHQNKTKKQILKIMSDYGEKDLYNHDCLIIVFLSHAATINNKPCIFATDDKVSLEDLTDSIIRNQTLRLKPKIFFIDHSRFKTKEKKKIASSVS